MGVLFHLSSQKEDLSFFPILNGKYNRGGMVGFSQALCRLGLWWAGEEQKSLCSTADICCSLFTDWSLAVEQGRKQQAGCSDKVFLNAWVGCILVVLSQILLSLLNLEYNSICFNGAIFQIYSVDGKKREKLMHRMGGRWKNSVPFPTAVFSEKSRWQQLLFC